MNLTLKHVAWCFGILAGGIVSAVIAPAWELAPIVVAVIGGLTGAVSAQCAIIPRVGLMIAVLSTVAGAMAMAYLANENPSWVVQRCSVAVCCGGCVGIAAGLIVNRFIRREQAGQTVRRFGS